MLKSLWILVLALVPSVTMAQGTRDFSQEDLLLQRILPFLSPTTPVALMVFVDNGIRHGNFMLNGRGPTTTTDLMGVATNVANAVRAQFAIPPEYTWKALEGGAMERKLVQPIGSDGWRNVGFALFIDDVPLEGSELRVTFDASGRTRVISGAIPRLRPEIVATVRGPRFNALSAVSVMRSDAAAQPAGNLFGFIPGELPRIFDFQTLATPQPPYIVYRANAKAALYRINAVTGAILDRHLMETR
jgi:hypothetical protein